MARNEKRTLNIRALMVDELSGQLSDIRRQIAKSAEATKKANERAAKSWRALKKAAGAALAVYGLFKSFQFTRAFTDEVDAIGKLANALGRPVEEVSELSAAFVRAGGSAEQFRAVFASVLSSVNGAIGGAKAQTEAFEALGLSARELKRLNPTEILAELASGAERLTDNNERLRQFALLFPEQYKNVLNLVGQGRKAFDQTLERVRRVGATVTQEQVNNAAALNDAWADVSDSLKSVGRELLVTFGPEATAGLGKLAEFIADNKPALVEFARVIKDVVVKAIDLLITGIIELIGYIEAIPGVNLLTSSLEAQIEAIESQFGADRNFTLDSTKPGGIVGSGFGSLDPKAFQAAKEQAAKLRELQAELARIGDETLSDRLREIKTRIETEAREAIAGVRQANKAVQDEVVKGAAETARLTLEEFERPFREGLPPNQIRDSSGGIWEDVEQFTIDEAYRVGTKAQEALVEGLTDVGSKVASTLSERFNKVLAPIRSAAAATGRALEKLVTGPTKFQSFFAGFEKGMERLTAQVKDFYGTLGQELARISTGTLDAFSDGLADVITGARTAKEAWKDFLNTSLQLVARLIARMITLRLVSAVTQSAGLSFAQGGVLSGVDGGQSVPVKAYRNGGVARRPQLALFGEGNRAEAFVPLPDNRSIPVTFTGNNGPSGSGAVINLNIYAWDSKDAARGLVENGETIRGIIQTGAETRNGLRQTIQRAAR